LGAEKEERAREGVRGKQDETEGGGGVKKKQIRGKDQHKEYKKAKVEGDEGGEEKWKHGKGRTKERKKVHQEGEKSMLTNTLFEHPISTMRSLPKTIITRSFSRTRLFKEDWSCRQLVIIYKKAKIERDEREE